MFAKIIRLLILLKDVIPALIDLFKKKPAAEPANKPAKKDDKKS